MDPDSKGTVAVDDLEAWVGPCKESTINCDFELQECGWKDDSSYPLEWCRVLAEEGAESVGYDHTTNTLTGEIHWKFL